MMVDLCQNPAITGHIHVCAGFISDRLDVIVSCHLVIQAEVFDKADIARRSQSNNIDCFVPLQHERESEGSLAGCTTQNDLLCPEEVVVAEVVVEYERRSEERTVDHLVIVECGVEPVFGRHQGVLVVDRRQRRAMLDGIGEPARRCFGWFHQQFIGHGKVAVIAVTGVDVVGGRAGYFRDAPHGNASPASISREEIPVPDHIAGNTVGDVVGGQGKPFDGKHCFTPAGVQRRGLDQAGIAQIIAANEKVVWHWFTPGEFRICRQFPVHPESITVPASSGSGRVFRPQPAVWHAAETGIRMPGVRG